MTIKQQGGIFGRNPTFNDVTIENDLTVTDDITGQSVTAETATITDTSSSFVNLYLTGSTSSTCRILMGDTDSGVVGQIRYSNSAESMEFRTGNSTAATFNSSGNLAFPSGQGIDFSATSGTGTSELFDDYEEGEWTPVVADASSGGNTGGGTLKGYYTKVGRTVFLVFSGSNITTSGMTSGNDLFITGLPYTPATVVGTNYYTGALVMHSVTTAGNGAAAIQDATNYIKLYETVSGAAFEFITVGDISTGVSDIRFSLTYEAA